MQPRLNLAAFHIPANPPGRAVPVVQVRTSDGDLVDVQQLAPAVAGPRGWDEQLRRMGYRRITRWTKTDVGLGGGASHICKVAPAPVMDVTGQAAAHVAAGLLLTCPSYTVLTRSHADQLGGFEFGFHTGDLIECEYAAGHRLPHVGLGQPGRYVGVDERKQPWTWLLWSGSEAILSEAMLCGVEGRALGNGGAIDPCGLPLGHDDGSPAHSWQLTIFNSFRPGSGVPRSARGAAPPRRPGDH